MLKRSSKLFVFIAFLLLSGILLSFLFLSFSPQSNKKPVLTPSPVHPTPTPFIFTAYTPPKLSTKDVYRIVMIGDSMTEAIGPHGGSLSESLNARYKDSENSPQRIIIDNYAISSNILAVNDELTKKKTISEYTFEPLLSTEFDLILVESFGYNPLSQFGIEEGLKKQTEALDVLMTTLITTHPQARIVFVATIAPNRAHYAQSTQPNTSSDNRAKLADERIAYIKNHIAYAAAHTIPLINIYEKSLTDNGDGNTRYINPTDDIHPSFVGIEFIADTITEYIYTNQILPR